MSKSMTHEFINIIYYKHGVYQTVPPELGPTPCANPVPHEDEYVSEAVLVSHFERGVEEEVGMRHLCRPGCGPQLEVPFLPHSSATVGSGSEADDNAKAKNEASHHVRPGGSYCAAWACPRSNNAV